LIDSIKTGLAAETAAGALLRRHREQSDVNGAGEYHRHSV